MNTKVNKAINAQINAEMYSAYLYLAMAAYFDDKSLPGFANWMKMQAQEEMSHAMKFYNYAYERGGVVKLDAIAKPPTNFKSPLAVMKEVLAHEKVVTSLINGLYELASKEKDYASKSFLKWYIDEQVEEEANASELIERLQLAGEKGPGLFMMDKELAGRQFVDETSSN